MAPTLQPRHRAGFTLVELLISISLGLVLLLTCFSGLRLTAQAVIASRQLATENAMLRMGVEHALEESDFWLKSDDPTNPSGQLLRGFESTPNAFPGVAWLPFTPFTQTNDYATDPMNGTTGFEDTATGFDEVSLHGGWNPHPLAWAAWNPRTWTRANVEETTAAYQCWGTCDIYDNLDRTKSWHYWYDDQVLGVLDSLGFYGIYEYMPSNAYYIYHGLRTPLASPSNNNNGNGSITFGSMPASLMQPGTWECPYDGCDFGMKGRTRNTNGSRFFMPSPLAEGTNPGLARTIANIGYNGRLYGSNTPISGLNANQPGFVNPALVTAFLANSVVFSDLLPIRPVNWDDVTCETHRYIEHGHPLILNLVSCRSSMTGNSFVISFTCLGTTLRGARQQRSPQGGWVVNPYTDATLDYQTPP